jgi:iron complex transport system permease protein
MSAVADELIEPRRPGHIVLRTRAFDLRFNWRVLTFVLIALGVAVSLSLWSMTLGSFPISVGDVFLAAIDQGTRQHEFIVQDLRMPRILAALLVGASLAMSGAIFQGLVRNELVSPDIIGINSGAAGIGFAWLLLTRDVSSLPLVLFGGAMGMATLIYAMSWKGGISPNRLILVGIGLQSMLGAVETFLVRRFPIEEVIWADNLLLGSVGNATWGDIRLLALGLMLFVPMALFMAWPLRALQLGDDTARTVGWPVEFVRFALMFVGCWLSALAITVAGLVGFIALMVPHAARMIAGPMSASVMLFTGVLGGFFLLTGDVIAHHFLPVSLPVSVVVGAFGAPYFLFLFWRSGVRL